MPAESPRTEELSALISLLEDPDPAVQQLVKARMVELGPAIVPRLKLELAEVEGRHRKQLKQVMHTLRFELLEQSWRKLLIAEDVSLEQGALLLSRYRFPDADLAHYTAMLDEWATVARSQFFNVTGIQRAFVLSDFMFGELGFEANERYYYDPNNSYLTWVLDHRRGIPVSLSVIYLLLAERLGLPMYGVNMPAHFLVKYDDGASEVFIDVFNAGTPFMKEDGIKFLERAGIHPDESYFQRASSRSILLRMLRNLLAIAHDAGQKRMMSDLERLAAPWDVIE